MTISPEVLDALLASGATAEMIVAAVKADMAKDEARREAKRANNAERQQRYRNRRSGRKATANNASNALRSVTPPIDNNHTPSVISSSEETTPSAERQRSAFVKPDWCEDDQDWQDFLANRKRKRLPNTASAYKGFLDDIARIADDEWPPGRLLAHAAAKGWGGIYDPRDAGKSTNARTPPSNRNTAELALAKLGVASR